MKNEILIQTRQRYWYDRCLELAGARLVEFGSPERTTREDLEEAIGPNSAAVHYYAVEQSPDPNALSFKDTVEIAKNHGLPVIVDSAGQIYPLDIFGKYVREGDDFQCIAAKYLGSPQSVGLALGTEKMIHQISMQSFVGYEGRRVRGVGRPQKIDRQEMIGAVAAVKHWLTMNHEERLINAEARSNVILSKLSGVPGIKVKLIDNIIGHQPFGVQLEIDESATDKTLHDIVEQLKAGNPPVWTRVKDDEQWISIHMFGLKDGEEKIVGDRISEIFSN